MSEKDIEIEENEKISIEKEPKEKKKKNIKISEEDEEITELKSILKELETKKFEKTFKIKINHPNLQLSEEDKNLKLLT
jgi:hypothetical protein